LAWIIGKWFGKAHKIIQERSGEVEMDKEENEVYLKSIEQIKH